MGVPLSVRLDDDVRDELEALASAKGVGLSTYVRELATEAARDARCERIRAESAAVATYVASSMEAQAFYEDWGTPSTDLG